jgi:hypothetical protein
LAAPRKNGRRDGNSGIMLAVLTAVVIKTIAAELPLIALRGPPTPAQEPPQVPARAETATLTVYRPIQTAAGLLDQTDLITRRPPPITGRAPTKAEPSGRTGSGLPELLVLDLCPDKTEADATWRLRAPGTGTDGIEACDSAEPGRGC